MTTEEAAQFVFEKRGYCVISSNLPCAIGEVIDDTDWSLNPFVQDRRPVKLVVIAETDEADQQAQADLVGITRWSNSDPRNKYYYYRVIAE